MNTETICRGLFLKATQKATPASEKAGNGSGNSLLVLEHLLSPQGSPEVMHGGLALSVPKPPIFPNAAPAQDAGCGDSARPKARARLPNQGDL